MTDLFQAFIPVIPEGSPDIVNLRESRQCCFCGNIFMKRRQMWRYPDSNYMCIACKTRVDRDTAKGVTSFNDTANRGG